VEGPMEHTILMEVDLSSVLGSEEAVTFVLQQSGDSPHRG
jgi:hypothetical protein